MHSPLRIKFIFSEIQVVKRLDSCCDVAVAQINYPSLKHTR